MYVIGHMCPICYVSHMSWCVSYMLRVTYVMVSLGCIRHLTGIYVIAQPSRPLRYLSHLVSLTSCLSHMLYLSHLVAMCHICGICGTCHKYGTCHKCGTCQNYQSGHKAVLGSDACLSHVGSITHEVCLPNVVSYRVRVIQGTCHTGYVSYRVRVIYGMCLPNVVCVTHDASRRHVVSTLQGTCHI